MKARLLICCLSASAAFCSPADDVYTKCADSVVTLDIYDRVLVKTGQGSGVVLENDTGNAINSVLRGPWILTNYHVIVRAGLVVATARDGTKSNAWVVFFDRDRDLALLQTHIPLKSSKLVAATQIKVGDEVFAIGAPKGLSWTLSSGIISALRQQDGLEIVQTSAPISPGSSGGGLFSAGSTLIGITSFEMREGQNLNFALRITSEFLASLHRYYGRGVAGIPAAIEEGEWNSGHAEPSELNAEHPTATPAWHSRFERMRKWNAYSEVIANIDARWRKATSGMSAADEEKSQRELLEEATGGRRSTDIVNRITSELRNAYILRFREFPDDIEGWDQAMNEMENKMELSEQVSNIRLGITRWPTDYRVIAHLMFAIMRCNKNPELASSLFRHVEKIVERIPTQTEVGKLLEPFEEAARVDVNYVKPSIEKLVSDIYSYTGNPLLASVSEARRQRVMERLRQKGWSLKPPAKR